VQSLCVCEPRVVGIGGGCVLGGGVQRGELWAPRLMAGRAGELVVGAKSGGPAGC
jgi:hypothetical protein